MILETERLFFRKFNKNDWEDLHDYLSRESVCEFEPYYPFSMSESKDEAARRSGLDCFIALCLKENLKLIGNLYFQLLEPEEFRTWELGFVLNPDFQGFGYATESCNALIGTLFEKYGARRIVAYCNPKNKSSWNLLERLGMRREGHLIGNVFFKKDSEGNPLWNDTYEYAILSEEWFEQNK